MKVTAEPAVKTLAAHLAEVLADYPISLAYLFGSAASGRTTPLSDVDIAVIVTEGAVARTERLQFELSLEAEIAERCGLAKADVRVINEAPLVIRGQVVTDGLLLFARSEPTRIDFETRTRSEYFDFLPTIEFHRQAFFLDIRQRGLHGQRSKN